MSSRCGVLSNFRLVSFFNVSFLSVSLRIVVIVMVVVAVAVAIVLVALAILMEVMAVKLVCSF